MDTQMAPLGASCIGYELFGLRRKRVTSSLDCMEGFTPKSAWSSPAVNADTFKISPLKPLPLRLMAQNKTSK
jgi:hypothetical protein